MGALFAFCFMTGQTFGVKLDQAVWKQIIGDKMLIDDLMNIDQSTYCRLNYKFP